MKALSIEEIKQMEINDWLYLKRTEPYDNRERYYSIKIKNIKSVVFGCGEGGYLAFSYDDYGKTWVAYKNKEQAECKGVLKNLICDIGDKVYIVNKDNTYRPIDEGIIDTIVIIEHDIIYEWNSYDYGCETIELWDEGEFTADDLGKSVFLDYEQAEQKLKELRGEL